MKQLKWPTNSEEAAYMSQRAEENLARSRSNRNENWFAAKIPQELRYRRQVKWGYRIFDFWFHDFGCAIEIDGPEHDANYDHYRDEYNFRRSGVVVLRVRNGNEQDAQSALTLLPTLGAWKERRENQIWKDKTKKGKRVLSSQPFNERLLDLFVAERRKHLEMDRECKERWEREP